MAKKKKTIEEMEQALSPKGLRLAKEGVERIDALTRNMQDVANSPEEDAIRELTQAYIAAGSTKN